MSSIDCPDLPPGAVTCTFTSLNRGEDASVITEEINLSQLDQFISRGFRQSQTHNRRDVVSVIREGPAKHGRSRWMGYRRGQNRKAAKRRAGTRSRIH